MNYGHDIPREERIMARLKELEEGRARLMRKLERSLAIRRLWPKAFEGGNVTTRVTGTVNMKLTVRNAQVRYIYLTWALEAVPAILREGIEHLGKRKTRMDSW